MAAFETPWTTSMSQTSSTAQGGSSQDNADRTNPPTVAAFSPNSYNIPTQQRSTILLHHKSPLLLATPPQVTRALAYSHPFIVPLNRLVGLLSWTTGDPWESFLMVAAFWFICLYGDEMLRYGGPLIFTIFLIAGMYFRRYSPLSSTGWTGEKQKSHKRNPSDVDVKHRKSLDEIVATLQTFTTRCNILMDPMLRLTDFLSTQQTATSATTRPALTTLFIRILLASPVWIGLTLPPLRIITTTRVVLAAGTIMLTWHSRPARISRSILWRSRSMRLILSTITGFTFTAPSQQHPSLHISSNTQSVSSAAALATKHANTREGIRFTFSVYENQRRWIGLGWTQNMFGYERAAWTDEHLNPSSDPQHYQLPDVEGGMAKWRWVEGGEWHIEIPHSDKATSPSTTTSTDSSSKKSSKAASKSEDENAWVYYDNKWADGRRGTDSWSRYTRRRKWVRDAELIDIDPTDVSETDLQSQAQNQTQTSLSRASSTSKDKDKESRKLRKKAGAGLKLKPSDAIDPGDWSGSDASSIATTPTSPGKTRRRSWFGKHTSSSSSAAKSPKSPRGSMEALERISSALGGGRRSASASVETLERLPSMVEVEEGAGSASVSGKGKEKEKEMGRSVPPSPSAPRIMLKKTPEWKGHGKSGSVVSITGSQDSVKSGRSRDDDFTTPLGRLREKEAEWGLGDDVIMHME